ncbi:MAG TPA: TonB-dependent receptor [Candidatus Limnocylindrales bacterium]|nr:TonB-dependent receptor [Candidatus Limnocylindrales bacterium]
MGPLAPIFRRVSAVALLTLASLTLAPAGFALAAGSDEDAPPAPGSPADVSPEHPRYRLDPVVVTADRFPIRLDRVPADVTVITSDRLEMRRTLLLADALRLAPGIDVQRAGTPGKLTDVRLRGADPRHTLVLYDGIPLNGPWIGSFDFADFMGAGSNQVEIFGGPASSLYGSGAVGGVIQILTPPGSDVPRRSIFAEYGEQATLRQGLTWQTPLGSTHAGISITRLTSEGFGARDAYSGLNGQLHLAVPIGTERLRVSALATQGNKELPYDFLFNPADTTLGPFGSLRQVRDPNNHEKDRILAGSVAYERALGPRVALEGEVSGFAGQIENQNPPNPPSTTDYQRTHLDNSRGIASLRGKFEAAAWAQAVIGAEYRAESVDRLDDSNSGGFGGVTEVTEDIQSRSIYGQSHLEWRDRVLLDSGIRLEDHSRYGAYGVPRVSLGFNVREAGLKLRAGYGRAFTAPTLTDLFYPGYGSPTLKPERSRTWEAGADGSWLEGRVTAKATWYTTRFQDLIQSNSFFVADNVGSARIEGEEYAARYKASTRLTVEARAAHLLGKNLVTGARLAKRPQWRTGASVEATAARGLVAVADWWWSASMLDPFVFVDADGRVLSGDTPERTSLDLGINASLARWVPAEVRLRVENALDRRFSDVKGFPARGRSFRVGLTLNP